MKHLLVFILLGLATTPTWAFKLNCRLQTEDIEATLGFNAQIGKTDLSLRGEYYPYFYCTNKKGAKVAFIGGDHVELGFFAVDRYMSAKRLILSCPTISLKQLKKRPNRRITVLGTEVGFLGTLGIDLGADNRGNPCFLTHVGMGDGGGVKVKYESFDLELVELKQ